jgi:hypothetical protein
MKQQLSPKRYIETRVRNLPIYKCLVNENWEKSRMANIIVMRKHTNGNITAGIYLIDLLCLGVKDTFYFFNVRESDMLDRLKENKDPLLFVEIDYDIAHNIIYAGHDFALEFDIHPHSYFSTTRFILKDDDDNVPLIDIPVGDFEGKPHLMVHGTNQYLEALGKLKHIAGEGNYHYTIYLGNGQEPFDNWEDEEDEYDEEEKISLDDIPLGELDSNNVQDISMEELLDREKTGKRLIFEKIYIHAEVISRMMPSEISECTPEEDAKWDEIWEASQGTSEWPVNVQQWQHDEYEKILAGVESFSASETSEKEDAINGFEERLIKTLKAHPSNPELVLYLYETSIALFFTRLNEITEQYAEAIYSDYPGIQLSLALGALIDGRRDERFGKIYSLPELKEVFPGHEKFYIGEVLNFWLIKMWVCVEEGKLKDAVQYYFMVREIGNKSLLFNPVLVKMNKALTDYFQKYFEEQRAAEDSLKKPGKVVPFNKY